MRAKFNLVFAALKWVERSGKKVEEKSCIIHLSRLHPSTENSRDKNQEAERRTRVPGRQSSTIPYSAAGAE